MTPLPPRPDPRGSRQPGPRRHHRYRHEERAYRRAVLVRRTCILVSLGLLLGTGLIVRHALERPDPALDPAAATPRTAQTARVVPPARAR